MKKILALLLALSMLFALTACGGDDKTTPTGESTGETTSTTESTNDATDGTEDSTQGTIENPADGETTDSTDTGENQTGTADSVAPLKYTRDEFLAKLNEYMSNHTPDRTSHFQDDYAPQEENFFSETYIVTDFSENHELNLLLHKSNNAVGKQANGWIVAEKWDYEYSDETAFLINLYYTIPCETFEEAVAYAKTDAYRIAPFYGLTQSQIEFTVIDIENIKESGKKPKPIQMTDEDLMKIAEGKYSVAGAVVGSSLTGGDSCQVHIAIDPTTDGKYEYSYSLKIQVNE